MGKLQVWGASSLLAFRAKPRTSLPAVRQTVRTIVKGPPKDTNVTDPKVDILRRTLYPANLRNRESPTGAWRPNVGRCLQRAIPSVQAHETIERAWRLHKRHIRRGRMAEIERKFNCMKEAMEALRELDTRLYLEANKEEDPRQKSDAEKELLKNIKGSEKRAIESRIRGLFPRELRIPTDTPPTSGWKYDWNPILRPLA